MQRDGKISSFETATTREKRLSVGKEERRGKDKEGEPGLWSS